MNTVFYDSAYALYRTDVFTPTLMGIAIVFGLGIAMDSLITFVMFVPFRRRIAIRS